MAKPILVVNYCIEGLPMEIIIHNLKSLQEVIENSGANEDYYTFVMPIKGDSRVEVFYDKDLDDNGFFNIRDLIDERLEELSEIHKPDEERIMEELVNYAKDLYPNGSTKRKWWQWRKRN